MLSINYRCVRSPYIEPRVGAMHLAIGQHALIECRLELQVVIPIRRANLGMILILILIVFKVRGP